MKKYFILFLFLPLMAGDYPKKPVKNQNPLFRTPAKTTANIIPETGSCAVFIILAVLEMPAAVFPGSILSAQATHIFLNLRRWLLPASLIQQDTGGISSLMALLILLMIRRKEHPGVLSRCRAMRTRIKNIWQ